MKYTANPVIVDAYKITKVSELPSFGVLVQLENGDEKICGDAMIARYTPVVGDYYVIQADDYRYVNPASVFERKYSPVIEG